VPAELLGSVEVFKNSTADRLEGGLSGTVNMNLRLPFDNRGFFLGYDVEANYADLDKKWSPVGSVLASNTWDTGTAVSGSSARSLFSAFSVPMPSGFPTSRRAMARIRTATRQEPLRICRAPFTSVDSSGFPSIFRQRSG
jgi:hypothetical protein